MNQYIGISLFGFMIFLFTLFLNSAVSFPLIKFRKKIVDHMMSAKKET